MLIAHDVFESRMKSCRIYSDGNRDSVNHVKAISSPCMSSHIWPLLGAPLLCFPVFKMSTLAINILLENKWLWGRKLRHIINNQEKACWSWEIHICLDTSIYVHQRKTALILLALVFNVAYIFENVTLKLLKYKGGGRFLKKL